VGTLVGTVGMSIKDLSDIVGKWTAIIAAIVGGYFALQQYIESQKKIFTDSQHEALSFFKQYSTEPVLQFRRSLEILESKVEDAHRGKPRDQSIKWDSVDEMLQDPHRSKMPHSLFNKMMMMAIKDNELQAMSRIIEFFGSLETCVKAKLCDRTTTAALLSGPAKIYLGYIDRSMLHGPETDIVEPLQFIADLSTQP
jgi:hypothetical protein